MEHEVGSVGFFENLSVMGWIGVAIWVIAIFLVFAKKEWFFHFDERLPRFDVFEKYGLLPEHMYIFMTIRFVVIGLVVFIVGKLLTMI